MHGRGVLQARRSSSGSPPAVLVAFLLALLSECGVSTVPRGHVEPQLQQGSDARLPADQPLPCRGPQGVQWTVQLHGRGPVDLP